MTFEVKNTLILQEWSIGQLHITFFVSVLLMIKMRKFAAG